MQVSGKVIGVKETVTKSSSNTGKDFSKREIWIETPDDKYPQTLSIEFTQDKVALLDNISINENVTIEINLRGRQWKDKVFNTIAGWKITVDAKPNESLMVKQESMTNSPVQIEDNIGDENDLPF